jgi:L-amino acid N-acyltransferase YncA
MTVNIAIHPSFTPCEVNIAEFADLSAIVSIYNQAIPYHRSTDKITQVSVEDRKA